ncbi:MAG: hypothetical protein COB20_13825, partial [SAR86 cluster bacterium]
MLIKVENVVHKLGHEISPLVSIIATLCLTLSISAFSQDSLPQLDLDLPLRLDFSGSWEKDFRRSDNWEDELSRT